MSSGKDMENITLTNSFRYCSVCRLMSPVFTFYDDEVQKHKTFCKICFYSVDVKSDDEEIEQLNLTTGVRNFE